jgi:hypothetical protein
MILGSWFNHIKYGADMPMTRDADFRGSGVIDPSSDFALTFPSTPNMTCTVGAGTSWCNGYRLENDGDDTITLTFAAADPSDDRIDLVQIGPKSEGAINPTLGLAQDFGTISVKTGTPAGSPTQPSPDANCVALYAVAIAAGQTSVTSGDVTDLRAAVTTQLYTASAVTPPAADYSTRVATTEWVADNISGVVVVTGATVLDNTYMGKMLRLAGGSSYDITLPAASTCRPGARLTIFDGSNVSNILRTGSDLIVIPISGTTTSLLMNTGDTLTLVCDGVQYWYPVSGATQLPYSAKFLNSIGGTGYQKFPGGLIVQWGTYSLAASTTCNVTFPIAFPNGFLGGGAFLPSNYVTITTTSATASGMTLTASSSGTTGGYWIVVGH